MSVFISQSHYDTVASNMNSYIFYEGKTRLTEQYAIWAVFENRTLHFDIKMILLKSVIYFVDFPK